MATEKGWEERSDGVLLAVPHFDMEKELMEIESEKARRREQKAAELRLEKERGIGKGGIARSPRERGL